MSSQKIVFSAIVLVILQIQVKGESSQPTGDHVLIQDTAFLAVKNLKEVLERTVDDGLEKIDDLIFEYKLKGDILKKDEQSSMEGHKTGSMSNVQAALQRGYRIGINAASICHAGTSEDFDMILSSSFKSKADLKLKEYYKNCENVTVHTDNVIHMKQDGVKLEEVLRKCTNKACFEDATKTAQTLSSTASSRLNNILSQARSELLRKEREFGKSLVRISLDTMAQMMSTKARMVRCIEDEIRQANPL